MAGSARLTATVANAMLNAGIGDQANNGKLRIYSGSQPASGGGAITSQVLLAQFNMANDAFIAASGGVLTAAAIAAAVGLANGQATWFRLLKSDSSTILLDGSVGVETDDPDVVIDDADITIGEPVAVTSFLITMPLSA